MDEDEEFMSYMLTRGKGGGGGSISGCLAWLTIGFIIVVAIVVGIAGCTSGSPGLALLAVLFLIWFIPKL